MTTNSNITAEQIASLLSDAAGLISDLSKGANLDRTQKAYGHGVQSDLFGTAAILLDADRGKGVRLQEQRERLSDTSLEEHLAEQEEVFKDQPARVDPNRPRDGTDYSRFYREGQFAQAHGKQLADCRSGHVNLMLYWIMGFCWQARRDLTRSHMLAMAEGFWAADNGLTENPYLNDFLSQAWREAKEVRLALQSEAKLSVKPTCSTFESKALKLAHCFTEEWIDGFLSETSSNPHMPVTYAHVEWQSGHNYARLRTAQIKEMQHLLPKKCKMGELYSDIQAHDPRLQNFSIEFYRGMLAAQGGEVRREDNPYVYNGRITQAAREWAKGFSTYNAHKEKQNEPR